MKAVVQTMLVAAAALAVAAGERGTPTNPTFIHSGTPGEPKGGVWAYFVGCMCSAYRCTKFKIIHLVQWPWMDGDVPCN